jgi:hypothetical protein
MKPPSNSTSELVVLLLKIQLLTVSGMCIQNDTRQKKERKKEINHHPTPLLGLWCCCCRSSCLQYQESAVRAIEDKRKEDSTVYLHFWACDVAVVAESVAFSVKKGQ